MDEMTTLYTLAARLLGRQYLYYVPDYDPATPPAHILVGAIPDDLPVVIPLPEDATIIGSVQDRSITPSNLYNWPQTQVLFDTSLSAEQVRDFYRARLGAEGWTQPEAQAQHGGFVVELGRVLERELFCRGERGPALWVNAYPQQGAATQVHLELDISTRQSPCARRAIIEHAHNLLPPLRLPPAARYVHGGWGGGGGSQDTAHSEMTIQVDLDLPSVRAYFDAQLEQTGWMRQSEETERVVTWSTWSFTDASGEPWRGELHVMRRPGRPQQYLLHLEGEWAGPH